MPQLTQAHEAAINAAIEVTEGRWRAAGSPEGDPRARMGALLRELLDMARAYTTLQSDPKATERLLSGQIQNTAVVFPEGMPTEEPPIKVDTADPYQYELDSLQEMVNKKERTVQINIGGSTTFEKKVDVKAALEAEGASEVDAAEAEKLNEE